MVERRVAVSTMVIAAALILVVVIGAAGCLLLGRGESQTQTMASSSKTSSRTSNDLGNLLVQSPAATFFAGPDVVANYTITLFLLGGNTSLTLSANAPAGVTVSFAPERITASSTAAFVQVSMAVSGGVAPGPFPLTVNASSAGGSFSRTFQAEIVKYLVVMVDKVFLPGNLSVPAGSSVTWVRLNGAIDQYDDGAHNVAFTSVLSSTSPTLEQYQAWSYAFSSAGRYSYTCTFHPGMDGVVNVT